MKRENHVICKLAAVVCAAGMMWPGVICGQELATDDVADLDERHRAFWEWDYLTGDWFGARETLADHGVEFTLDYYAEVWGNTVGGMRRGAVYTGLFELGMDVDFERLIGWKGASFSTSWLWISGQNASEQLVGNIFDVSNIAGFPTFRLFEMWLQQNLFEDMISIRVGQLAADSEFVISEYAELFLNGTFGWPAFLYENLPGGGPAYPLGTPGVRLELNPLDWLTLRGAVFQGSPFDENVNRHGFRYRLDAATGFFSIHELEVRANQDGGPFLPGTFKGGAWFHTADFAALPDEDSTLPWNYGFYFIADQMLYRPPSAAAADNGDGPEPGIGSFFRIAFEPQDRNIISFYLDTGLAWTGLIPGRPADTAGVAFAYGQLGGGGRGLFAAEGERNPDYEMALEFTYQVQVTPWMILQPDLQYIIHPGASQTFGNSLVLGMRSVISF